MAAVTLDDYCKITRWDQFGDDAMQQKVDDVIADMMQNEIIQCVEFNRNC